MASLQSFNDPDVTARLRLAVAYRVRKLHEMLTHTVTDTHDEPDTDRIELQDFKFYPGDTVSLYSRKLEEASKWRVLAVLDEMLSLQCAQATSDC